MSWDGRIRADARHLPIANESVQCVITSPPYWGLRDYGTGRWEGGDPDCKHLQPVGQRQDVGRAQVNGFHGSNKPSVLAERPFTDTCGLCGAIRVDSQIGLERTPDEYVSTMVGVFREVWRVLKPDGTLWLNLGDCYGTRGGDTYSGFNSRWHGAAYAGKQADTAGAFPRSEVHTGLKPKDLVGIPWRVAFALQQPQEEVTIKNPIDRAWLAAMIDGEGCITTTVAKPTTGINEAYAVVLLVRMCDRECLGRIVEITGMSHVQAEAQPPSHIENNQRPSSVWKIAGDNAATILAEIYPYLLIKKRQALAAWNLQRLKDGVVTKRGVPVPAANMEQRRELHRVIRGLNQREQVDIPSWCIEPFFHVHPGWYLRSDVIWAKPNPMPESVTDRPTKAHEYIFLLTKSERYYYDQEAIKEPATYAAPNAPDKITSPYGQGFTRRATYEEESGRNDGGLHVSGGFVRSDELFRNKRSVWTISTQPYPEAHYATFPEEIPEICIKAGTKPGDIVLDPFFGSGTVGRVAERLNRRWIGCDLGYQHLQAKRVSNVQKVLTEVL